MDIEKNAWRSCRDSDGNARSVHFYTESIQALMQCSCKVFWDHQIICLVI